ncbi:MAG: DUF2975 domain-containing protein [Eubacteriales bacterium]|nr:DUF2975 domain-containing protein [Eubacteriales bacterium]
MKKGLNKTLSLITKVIEIVSWVGAAAGLVSFVGSLVDKSFIKELFLTESTELPGICFSVDALTETGDINYFAVSMFFIGLALTFVLMAMIFRNINIILRTMLGKYKHAKGTSPFQKDVVRQIREIGIFSIAMPVLGLIITTIINIVSKINSTPVEASVSFGGIIIGLVCLCLTQIFSYGAQLEEEVDGLL